MKVLIRNGRIVDPASRRDEVGDVAIAAGRIVGLGRVSADFEPERTVDATSLQSTPSRDHNAMERVISPVTSKKPARWFGQM